MNTAAVIPGESYLDAAIALIRYKYNALGVNLPELSEEEISGRIITLEEVSWHDKPSDCWIIIYDRVYDVTDFLEEHPGGSDLLMESAGRDATNAFRCSGHSAQAIKSLDKYFVGELPVKERIFRKPGGYQISDMPV